MKTQTWDDFRKTGLLLFINQFLHIFGWAIVCQTDSLGVVTHAYPARVKFRGFDNTDTIEAYEKIANFMSENYEQLLKDVNIDGK
jgi:hypothetical protein